MSKYSPITNFLKNQPENIHDITVSYDTLEEVLGDTLPESAYVHRTWWGNEKDKGRSQAKSWMEAGWKVDSVDFSKVRVRFTRESGSTKGGVSKIVRSKKSNTGNKAEENPPSFLSPKPSKMGKQRIVLVSCVKRKDSKPMPAQRLYTSDLFQKTSTFGKSLGDSWYILSAKYGLVHPVEVISPYEKTLNKMPGAERKDWAKKVLDSLKDIVAPGDEIIFLAGVRYRQDLIPTLERWGCKTSIPMEGLTFGQQLSWLKKQLGQ